MVNQKCITTTKLCRDILKIPKEELLALLADRQSYYVPFEKKKITAGGRVKIRTIEPPHGYLKRVLKKINTTVLQPQMERLPYGVMGGRKGYSVVDNAKYHASSPALMKYDIKDFFPSIKYVDVFHILIGRVKRLRLTLPTSWLSVRLRWMLDIALINWLTLISPSGKVRRRAI